MVAASKISRNLMIWISKLGPKRERDNLHNLHYLNGEKYLTPDSFLITPYLCSLCVIKVMGNGYVINLPSSWYCSGGMDLKSPGKTRVFATKHAISYCPDSKITRFENIVTK